MGYCSPLYNTPPSLPLIFLLPPLLPSFSLSLPYSPAPFMSHRPPYNHAPTFLRYHHLKICLLPKIPHSGLLLVHPHSPAEANILVTHKLKVVSHMLRGGSLYYHSSSSSKRNGGKRNSNKKLKTTCAKFLNSFQRGGKK